MRAAILVLALCQAVHGASFFKGMTVSCQTSGWEWATPEMHATIEELREIGVTAIAIHPYARVQEDGHVMMRRAGDNSYVTKPIGWAHEKGMSAMVIPHIAYWGTKFSWRGEINYDAPEQWDRFFSDYQEWIVSMARLAESEHAEVFCVGLEFSYAQKFTERWRRIIAAVRDVYHGKLTYGANWNEFKAVKFWDALDYIGVLAYFPLTKEANPGEQTLEAGWDRWLEQLAGVSAANRDKQLLFVEVGYNESARAAAEPWAFKTGGEHAAEVQRRCIEVALRLPEKLPCLAGMFWWKWFPELPHDEEENYCLQTPAIKALIAQHWRAPASN